MSEELVVFFKALADSSRLKILGLLARQPYSGEELAALLDLKPSTVSHHLTRLAEAGLVAARAEGYYSIYQLETAALERVRLLFPSQDLASAAAGVDANAYDRKVIADYTSPDGRLKTIPAQRKKLEAILRHVSRAFAPGRHYSEKETNELLARYHEDTATLRRELVGCGLLERQGGGGDYWRAGVGATNE
ncbi:MAG: metalloregulator ArsR/SmtB family transcription factor [Anaerolineales bacterium]|nr:metalloregulator ArsR/SmtB family transcription factor [Anaerolineales bacterium]